jgi:hypothetical protein
MHEIYLYIAAYTGQLNQINNKLWCNSSQPVKDRCTSVMDMRCDH